MVGSPHQGPERKGLCLESVSVGDSLFSAPAPEAYRAAGPALAERQAQPAPRAAAERPALPALPAMGERLAVEATQERSALDVCAAEVHEAAQVLHSRCGT